MIRYNLDLIGWLQFEQLAQSLTKAEFGFTESWGGHSDLGRDAYSTIKLSRKDGTSLKPPVLFQAKHVDGANAAGANSEDAILASVGKECQLIKERLEQQKAWKKPPRTYVLMTNAPLPAKVRTTISEKLQGVLPKCTVLAWGANDLCDLLDNHPNVRLAFPQILTYRDLSTLLASIINKAVLERTSSVLEQIKSLLNLFVPTRTYFRAFEILEKHHFAVLTGPPEMGKTAIGRILSWAKAQEEWQILVCVSPSEVLQLYDRERPQVFFVDDAFGSTEYHSELALPWGQELSSVLRKMDDTHWLIWTSRPVPLHLALGHLHLQDDARHFPQPGEVSVDASALTLEEKTKMLYRHAKAANLDDQYKGLLKAHCRMIVRHDHFTPERIRRFVSETLVTLPVAQESSWESRRPVMQAVASEIERPTKSMLVSFERLKEPHKVFLFAMIDSGNASVPLGSVHEAYSRLGNRRFRYSPEQIAADLDQHFIRRTGVTSASGDTNDGHEARYDWIHPSWRDIVIDALGSQERYREQFLSKCRSNGLVLALSIGGGSQGKRTFPFLRNARDWRLLQSRGIELAGEIGMEEAKQILTSLDASHGFAATDAPKRVQAVKDISVSFLSALREAWNESDVPIDLEVLSAYLKLTLIGDQLLPVPRLDQTWILQWAAFETDLESDDVKYWGRSAAFERWAELVFLIKKNEPRFLSLATFPDRYVPAVNRLAEIWKGYDHSCLCSPTKAELASEIEHVREWQLLLVRIGRLMPKTQTVIEAVNKHLEREIKRLEEDKDEAPEPAKIPRASKVNDLAGSVELFRDSDIEAVFADL